MTKPVSDAFALYQAQEKIVRLRRERQNERKLLRRWRDLFERLAPVDLVEATRIALKEPTITGEDAQQKGQADAEHRALKFKPNEATPPKGGQE